MLAEFQYIYSVVVRDPRDIDALRSTDISVATAEEAAGTTSAAFDYSPHLELPLSAQSSAPFRPPRLDRNSTPPALS
jgi:hypothetical protein